MRPIIHYRPLLPAKTMTQTARPMVHSQLQRFTRLPQYEPLQQAPHIHLVEPDFALLLPSDVLYGHLPAQATIVDGHSHWQVLTLPVTYDPAPEPTAETPLFCHWDTGALLPLHQLLEPATTLILYRRALGSSER